jgi:hypothetical protein
VPGASDSNGDHRELTTPGRSDRIAGAVAFQHRGAVVSLTLALTNSGYAAARLVKGTMPCSRG